MVSPRREPEVPGLDNKKATKVREGSDQESIGLPFFSFPFNPKTPGAFPR